MSALEDDVWEVLDLGESSKGITQSERKEGGIVKRAGREWPFEGRKKGGREGFGKVSLTPPLACSLLPSHETTKSNS